MLVIPVYSTKHVCLTYATIDCESKTLQNGKSIKLKLKQVEKMLKINLFSFHFPSNKKYLKRMGIVCFFSCIEQSNEDLGDYS